MLVGRSSSPWRETFREWSRNTEARDAVIDLGEIEDEELRGFYSQAAAFLLPSLYEGFGLTVLEAMAAGTPTVSSNRGALPETVDGAGFLADPFDGDTWLEKVTSILDSSYVSDRLSGLGRKRARELSWSIQTAKLLEVFDEAAGE